MAIEAKGMAKSKEAKTAAVRLTDDAQKWAKIASGYTGESVPDYISRVVVERGKADAARLHAELAADPKRRGVKGE
jgi:hypothetical protein